MQLHVLGVTRRFGKGRESGNDYDMAFLNSLTELRSSKNENSTFQAKGFRQLEIELLPEAVAQFLSLDYPCDIEVLTVNRPGQSGLITVVSGIVK